MDDRRSKDRFDRNANRREAGQRQNEHDQQNEDIYYNRYEAQERPYTTEPEWSYYDTNRMDRIEADPSQQNQYQDQDRSSMNRDRQSLEGRYGNQPNRDRFEDQQVGYERYRNYELGLKPRDKDEMYGEARMGWIDRSRLENVPEENDGRPRQPAQNFRGKGPKGYKRSDERILEDVNEALYHHPRVDASEIEVTLKNGLITLSGTVDSREAKRLAENAIENCAGVTDIINRLQIRSKAQNSNATQKAAPR